MEEKGEERERERELYTQQMHGEGCHLMFDWFQGLREDHFLLVAILNILFKFCGIEKEEER